MIHRTSPVYRAVTGQGQKGAAVTPTPRFPICCAIAAILLAAQTAHAVAPQLNNILPRGAQRGTDAEVSFHGRNFGGAVDLLFHQPGIALVEMTPESDGTVNATLRIDPDCPVGLHAIRVRTSTGISNLQLFSVGNLTEIAEEEPNDTPATAQEIPLGVTINGVVQSEDVDYFAVHLDEGGRLAVESEAIRLGPVLFDIKLRLFGPAGHELLAEDDTPLFRQDAGFVFTAPEAGRYLVAVSEASYGGNGNFRYRLHVGEFPRPFSVTPLGGQPGAELEVAWLGDPAIEEATVIAPAVDYGTAAIHPASGLGVAPTPIPFRVSPLPGVREVEPNNAIEQATMGQVPGAFDGVIGEPGDTDWFAFEGKEGQVFDFRVWANELGSPLDSVMALRQPTENKQIASDDDSRGLDSYFRATLPEDGVYHLWIADHLRRGGPAFAYRVEVTPVEPSLSFRAEQNENAMIPVPRGNRNLLLLAVSRSEFNEDIEITFENLPEGLTADQTLLPKGENILPVVLTAGTDAPQGGALLDVVGTSNDITGRFNQQIVLVYGANRTIFTDHWVDRLATAVTEEAPFEIHIAETHTPVVQNSSKYLTVVAKRAEGFEEPINLRVPWLPNAYGAGTATIPGNQTEAAILIEAKGNASPGTVDVIVVGESAGWQVSTPRTPIEVTPQWVTFQVANIDVEQGQPAEVVVEVQQHHPYEGTFQAEMASLPKGVSTEPQPFTSETTELRFPLAVAEDAPKGKHSAMVLTTTIDVGGEPVRHVSGGAEMKIYEPLPPALQQAAAPEETEEEAPEPAPERKTRFPGSTQ